MSNDAPARPIRTHYYHDRELVKTTASKYSTTAVPHCIDHMQIDEYGANVAEVFDERDGVLHAVIRRSIKSDIHIVFKREVREGE